MSYVRANFISLLISTAHIFLSLPRSRNQHPRTTRTRSVLGATPQARKHPNSPGAWLGRSPWCVPQIDSRRLPYGSNLDNTPDLVVYTDGSRRPDPTAFSKLDLWHSDVSYEVQPPSTTSLKVIYGPPYGGDTLWTSGSVSYNMVSSVILITLSRSYSLYSSFSPSFQKYLESLSAVHSAVAQADGARAAGRPVRREAVETVHPIVRVHPVTGWKAIYVNPGKFFPSLSNTPHPQPFVSDQASLDASSESPNPNRTTVRPSPTGSHARPTLGL